jgi:hypothetical protein
VIATNVVSNIANTLANSLTSVRRWRQLLVLVSPILEPEPEPQLAPTLAKRTRKCKALEGVGSVDMGLRKLRGRK